MLHPWHVTQGPAQLRAQKDARVLFGTVMERGTPKIRANRRIESTTQSPIETGQETTSVYCPFFFFFKYFLLPGQRGRGKLTAQGPGTSIIVLAHD